MHSAPQASDNSGQAHRYQVRAVPVEAIRYLPPENCEQVWKFLDWPWPDDDHDAAECNRDAPLEPSSNGYTGVDRGDWIVKYGPDEFRAHTSDEFARIYEAAP